MPEASIRRIGKYEIRAELGRGGFGKVYRAYDPSVGRLVAIKVLTAEGNKDLLTRFRNEAAAAGNLRHKNIVTIYDFGDHNGLPYLVMEFLEGEDLQHVITTQKQIPLLQKVNIMAQVADGLYCAHSNGVVHRDVKPGNIRLLPDGSVKIMDFGIARLLGDAIATRLTRQGHVIGTLMYMAPEQVMGSDVDFLCDIFAYGTTYYEFLTGKHPFQAADPRAVFYKITAEDPEPIRNLAPECPEALEQIVRRSLHKERELRYQSFRDIQFDSEPILMELRQERAAERLIEANELFTKEQIELAQAVVGDALALDPANREARQLRETIQNRLTRRLLQPRIDALLAKAEEALAQRHYSEALDNVESAFRLDRTNSAIQSRVESTRAVVERNRKVIRLLAEARTDFARQDLVAATSKLQEALDLDPEFQEARQFATVVQGEIEKREKLRVVQEKLREAEELLRQESFNAASALLNALEPEFRDRQDVQELRARIETKRWEYERRRQLMAAIDNVGALLQDGRHEESIRQLERLELQFPEAPQIPKLLQYARNELRARQKAEALQKLNQDVRAFIGVFEFDRALKLIDDLSERYPNEAAAHTLREEVRCAEAAWQRAEGLRAAIANANEFLRAGQPHGALHLLNAAAAEYAAEAELCTEIASAEEAIRQEALRREREEAVGQIKLRCAALTSEKRFAEALAEVEALLGKYQGLADLIELRARLQRAKSVHEAVLAADALIREGEPERAVDMLTAANKQHPDEAGLRSAITQAQEAVRNKAIESLCASARGQIFEEAVETLDQGLRIYPDEQRLIELRRAIFEEREEAIRSIQARCAALASEHKYSAALDAVQELLSRYPGAAELVELSHPLQRAKSVHETVLQADRSICTGEPEHAVELLSASKTRYPDEGVLDLAMARAEEAVRNKAIESLCAVARQQVFDDAFHTLDEGLRKYPGDNRLIDLKTALRAKAILEAVRKTDALIGDGEPERALELITVANARFPDEADIAAATARAQEAVRNKEIDALCSAARGQADAKSFDEALITLDDALRRYPGNIRLIELRAAIRAEAIREITQEAAALVRAGEAERAVELLNAANARFPNEADIAAATIRTQEAVRNNAVEAVYAAARQQAFEAAVRTLDEGLITYPGEQKLIGLRRAIISEREETIQEIKRNCAALISEKRFDEAVELLDQYPGAPEFVGLRDRLQRAKSVHEAVQESNALIRDGEPERALELLTAADARYPGEADLANARTRAEEAVRNKAVKSLCAAAREQDFEQALVTLDDGLRRYPGDPRCVNLQLTIRGQAVRQIVEQVDASIRDGEPERAAELLRAAKARYSGEADLLNASARVKEAITRNRAIQEALRESEALCSQKLFDKAIQTIDVCVKQFGPEDVLSEQRQRIENARQKQQRLDAIARAIKDADERIEKGYPEKAVDLLESAVAQYTAHAELADALAKAREAIKRKAIEKICAEARRFAESKDLGCGLAVVGEGLKQYGADPALLTLKNRLEVQQAVESAGTLIHDGRPEEALKSLKAAASRYPAEPDLSSAIARTQAEIKAKAIEAICTEARVLFEKGALGESLRLIEDGLVAYPGESRLAQIKFAVLEGKAKRQREEAIQQTLERCRELGTRERFDEALGAIETAMRKYGRDAALMELQQRLKSDWERQQRAEAILRAVHGAEDLMTRGQPAKALSLLQAASARFPDDPELGGALVRAQQAVVLQKREAEVENVCRETRIHIDAREFDQAQNVVEKALQTYGGRDALTKLRETVLVARADCEQQNRARQALETENVEKLCRETRLYIEAKDFNAAQRQIEQGLKKHSGEIRLTQMRETVLAARADWEAELRRTRLSPVTSQSTQAVTDEILIPSPSDDVAPPPTPPETHEITSEPPRRRVKMLVPVLAILSAALGMVGYLALRLVHRAQPEIVLDVLSTPLGAAVRIGEKSCVTPDCHLPLTPGQYSVEITKEGFQTKIETVTLDPGMTGSKLETTLDPKPAPVERSAIPEQTPTGYDSGSLIVNTGAETATILIDGKPFERQTAGGRLSIPLAPKSYTLRVEKPGYDVKPESLRVQVKGGAQTTARFRLEPKGATLGISDLPRGTKVTLDGKLAEIVGADGSFRVQKLAPGEHRIELSKDGYVPTLIARSLAPGSTLGLGKQDFQFVAIPPPPKKEEPLRPPKVDVPSVSKPDPIAIENSAWQAVKNTRSQAELENFLKAHPDGRKAQVARNRIEQLEYEALAKTDRAALERFATKYRDTSYAQQARDEIAKIDREIESQKKRKAEQLLSVERNAIAGVLQRYSEAFRNKDRTLLRSTWPGISKEKLRSIEDAFKNFSSVSVELRPVADAEISGDSARIKCRLIADSVDRNGSHINQSTVLIELVRKNGQWVIDAMK